MSDKHDFKEVLASFPEPLSSGICDYDDADLYYFFNKKGVSETIQTALRIADRLQSGEASEDAD